jgi:hypothetical protein
MKNIKNYINESSNTWKYFSSVTDPSGAAIKLSGLENKDAKWLYIDMNNQMITPYTEDDLKQWTKDYEGDDTGEKAIKALKIGEIYNADDNNLYVRIK